MNRRQFVAWQINCRLTILGTLSCLALLLSQAALAKPRVIVTTDGEIDDRCSMIRFLLYADQWDIRGLIHSSSKYHWKGDDQHPPHDWEPVAWLDRQLDAYSSVYPNLKLHEQEYPTPDTLRSLVFEGNVGFEGDMRAPTPGSTRIVEVLLDLDDSPVWLQAWGGSNTIARALKTIKEKHPDRVAEVAEKARIYLITEQDNTFKTYLRPEWPEIQILRSGGPSFGAIAYDWKRMQSKETQAYFDRDWMTTNILEGHGPLCEMYEAKDGSFRSEGDSPAFLHLINTGLGSSEHPSFGGWGGRFAFLHGVWKSVDKKDSSPHSILRWADAFQNDWASRADWCVESPTEANHPPQVVLSGDVAREARAGDRVGLDARRSHDRDGDSLAYQWWHYAAAGTYSGPLRINNPTQAQATIVVPSAAQEDETIHLVCQVNDQQSPPLTRYQRVIVTISK